MVMPSVVIRWNDQHVRQKNEEEKEKKRKKGAKKKEETEKYTAD